MAVAPSRHLVARLPSNIWETQRVFTEAFRGLKCKDCMHVNHSTCFAAFLDMARASSYGSARFFAVYFMFYFVVNYKRALALDKKFYKQQLVAFVRTTMCGTTVASVYLLSACMISRLINGFNYWVSSFIPGVVAGYALMLDHPVRRQSDMNALENVALQYLYQRFQSCGYFPQTQMGETILFMGVNATLMYLLRTATIKPSVFWFYTPQKAIDGETQKDGVSKRCCVPHNGSCWASALKVTQRYITFTAGLQACRLLLTIGREVFHKPSIFFRKYFSRNTAALVTSIGGYVFLFNHLRCMLAKWFGKDHPRHSAQAGLAAGALFWLQPNPTIMSSAIGATIQLLYDRLPKEFKPSDKWMIGQNAAALSVGVLFHARCMDMKHCPDFVYRLTDIATHYRSSRIQEVLLQRMVKKNLI